jgi:hypothetical protein
MKKLMMISLLTLSCSAFIPTVCSAQTGSKMQEHKMEMKEGTVMMKDSKMMAMKGGSWVPMDKEMTMNNGTKVMTDGTVMMKDGKKKMLTNGDCVKPDGMVHKSMEKKM